MKQTTISKVTGKEYCPDECIRILSFKQIIYYYGKGIYPVDMFPSRDYKTGMPILVFMVKKEDSKEAYKEWLEIRAQEQKV
jgi:hypothetical protein